MLHVLPIIYLSVGQLISCGYSVVFKNECSNSHKQSGSKIFHVKMTPNRMFSLDVSVGLKHSALVLRRILSLIYGISDMVIQTIEG